jgi:hypothetical protein
MPTETMKMKFNTLMKILMKIIRTFSRSKQQGYHQEGDTPQYKILGLDRYKVKGD